MELLRKTDEPNERIERTGNRLIFASRFGNMFSLKFTRYGEYLTHMRVYSIAQDYFEHLTTYYGRLIDHSRIKSEYLIVPNRRYTDMWIANCSKHKQTNIIAVYPNNTTQLLENRGVRHIQDLATQRVQWYPEYDQEKNRWLVTHFPVNTLDLITEMCYNKISHN